MSTHVNMTARAWAASKGLCKGRGRMPQAAKDAIAQAEREGMVFLDPDLTGVRPSDGLAPLGEGEATEEVAPHLSKAAAATQARLGRLHEEDAFEALRLRKVTFIDGAGGRVRAVITARRDLFRTYTSMTLGPCFDVSTDLGWRAFPLSRVVKIGKVDVKAKAEMHERAKRAAAVEAAKEARRAS